MSTKLEISLEEMQRISKEEKRVKEKSGSGSCEAIRDQGLKELFVRYENFIETSSVTSNYYDKQYFLFELEKIANELLKIVKRERREVPENFIVKEFQKPLIQIEKNGNIVKLTLDENLPHEPRFNKSTGEWRYVYDTQEYYTWAWESTIEYFKKNEPFVFKEKCAVLFVSYYDEKTNPVDHDNVAVKYLIDGALRPFLCGDSPFELSHLYEGKKSSRSYTEVYLGPVREIYEYALNNIVE